MSALLPGRPQAARLAWDLQRQAPARLARSVRRRALVRTVLALAVASWLGFSGARLAAAFVLALALLLSIPGLVAPSTAGKAIDARLARFTELLLQALAWLLLTPLYFLVIVPLGLLLRALGKWRGRWQPGTDSLWQAPTEPQGRYDEPF